MLFADPTTEFGYIGVSTCPIWRFRLCRDHTDGFRPHCDAYGRMHIIFVERDEPAMVMEEHLIELTRESEHARKVQNGTRYVAGTIKPKQITFLYVCVKARLLVDPLDESM